MTRLLNWVMSAVVLIDVVGFVLHIGRISFFLGGSGRTAAIGAEVLMLLIGAAACVILQMWSVLFIAFLIAVYIFAQAVLFAHNFGTEIVIAAQSGFLGWLSILVFAPALKVLGQEKLVNLLFLVTLGYAVFYLLLSLGVPGFQPPVDNTELLSLKSDEALGRPSRFVMLSAMLAFGCYVSMSRIMRRGQPLYLASLLLCIAAIWLSYSRTATLMIFLVGAGYVAIRNVRLIGWFSLGALVIAGGALVLGLLSPHFYPFDLFGARDLSAVARGHEYNLMRHVIFDYWLFGVGFSPGQEATSAVVSYGWFYVSDLGAAGVFFEAGLVGLALFLIASIVSALPSGWLKRLGYDRTNTEALALTGCASTLFGVLWPELWNNTATLFGALFLAAALVAPPQQVRQDD